MVSLYNHSRIHPQETLCIPGSSSHLASHSELMQWSVKEKVLSCSWLSSTWKTDNCEVQQTTQKLEGM